MRKYYLDNIRWTTGILVVIYHVIYMYNGIIAAGVIGPFAEPQYQDAIQYLLYPWFMVLLFIVSGISARLHLSRHTLKNFLYSRTRKLLVPSTIGLFTFQWILGYLNMYIAGAFDHIPASTPRIFLYGIMVLSGVGVLWYIQMLWLFSMLLVLVRRIETGKLYHLGKKIGFPILLLLGVFLWGAAQLFNTPYVVVYRFGIYGFAFFLGYFVFSHEEVINCLSKKWAFLSVIAVCMGISYTHYYFGQNYSAKPVVNSIFSIGYAWVMILFIFAVFKRWFDRTGPVLFWMSRHSFGLYVFHYLPLAAAAVFIDPYLRGFPVLCYLIISIAAFGGGYLLNEVICRIPVLRWCVLGIRKGEKYVSGKSDPAAKAEQPVSGGVGRKN